jgi:hypothetical protein
MAMGLIPSRCLLQMIIIPSIVVFVIEARLTGKSVLDDML